MRASTRILLLSVSTVAGLFLLAGADAEARCPPPSVVNTIYVGDTARDNRCHFNTIQAAIDHATCPNTTIVVTNSLSYNLQRLSIVDKSLAIVGGNQCGLVIGRTQAMDGADSANSADLAQSIDTQEPAAPAAAAQVTIRGVGSRGNASVFSITGNSNVTLRNLKITNGNVPFSEFGGYGGGIYYYGAGRLRLDNVTVVQNLAGYGGGINMTGAGGPAELRIGRDMLITGNTAQRSGGGIRIDGSARLFMLEDNTGVIFNHALGQDGLGYGGGVLVVGPARADIGSPGYFGLGVIYLNDADAGGGLAVVSGSGDASTRLFTVDPSRPVRIQGNSATNVGGGVLVKPRSDSGSTNFGMATFCASEFRMDDNLAPDGTAIYADIDTIAGGTTPWSTVVLNREQTASSMCLHPESPAALGAVACAAGVVCNAIDNNAALTLGGEPTEGAAVLVQSSSFLYADRVALRGNQGGPVVQALAGTGRLELSNCLFARNLGGVAVVDSNTDTVIDNCTLSGNNVGPIGPALRVGAALSLTRSIIDQHEVSNLAYSGPAGGLVVDYLLSITSAGLPSGPTIVRGDPQFVAPSNGDFHLLPTSPAIDFAPPPIPPLDHHADLDGLPHDVDLAVANRFGPRDLGALERQSD